MEVEEVEASSERGGRDRGAEVVEGGKGGGCSNERNLHDFACFSTPCLRPSGFNCLPTFSACFSDYDGVRVRRMKKKRREEETEVKVEE
ncbi:hypothetical protein HZH66_012274 [Vespula vulgaris]|uniref:Uncharacterized protein n=1 Tax=Vespula vulgaris TaxID=7454 RepID=A0A834MW40_VESVU|nr:hypothetical protein HZH66_012274 [Vespula vulgaris]